MCADSVTMAWTNWQNPQKAISRRYEEKFYNDIFNDFAARMEWADKGIGNINPVVIVNGKKGLAPVKIKAKGGETVTLDASRSYDPNGDRLAFQWWCQPDAGTYDKNIVMTEQSPKLRFAVPADAKGAEIHLICEVHDNGRIPLVSYRRVIIGIED